MHSLFLMKEVPFWVILKRDYKRKLYRQRDALWRYFSLKYIDACYGVSYNICVHIFLKQLVLHIDTNGGEE